MDVEDYNFMYGQMITVECNIYIIHDTTEYCTILPISEVKEPNSTYL